MADSEQTYSEYLNAYVKSLGGKDASRTDHGDVTEPMRTAVALAAFDATQKVAPRTKADLTAEVRRLLEAPATPPDPGGYDLGRIPRRE